MPPLWTPVALARDLPPLVVMPVMVAGQDLALWRSASGRVAVWADRCPHRGMRLSHGFVRGEALSCIYHGWSYGAAGQCLRIPAHPDLEPPEAIRVPVHAVHESDGVIWAALSRPDQPPPALPDLIPLRSITVDGTLDAEPAGLALSGPVARGHLADLSVTLLIQPARSGQVWHALTTPGATPAQRITLSRALESLRRMAEAVAA